MSEFDTEEQGSQDEQSIEELQKKLARLEKDNQKYREERRKSQEAAFLEKYGEEIVAEVADLPEELRGKWAEKLLASKPQATPEADEPAPEEPSKVEVPAGLAAVAQAPATGGPEPQTMTPDEFKQHVDTEGLTVAAQKYGHMVRFPDIDNPLATGRAADIKGVYRPPS